MNTERSDRQEQVRAEEALRLLAEREIQVLKSMKQPVARLSGPLTTGSLGYEKNMERFQRAETTLREKDINVYLLAPSEEEIYGKGYAHEDVMDYFHKPLLDSGYFKTAYFLPGWELSKGASWEREYIATHTSIEIREFPEAWF